MKKVCSLLLYGEELAAHIEKKRKLKAIKMHLKRTFHFSLNAFGCEGIDLPPNEFCLLNCVPNRESLNYQPFDIDEVPHKCHVLHTLQNKNWSGGRQS